MQLNKVIESVENFKHINKIMILSGMLAFSSGYILVDLDAKRLDLEAQRADNKDASLLMTVKKASNVIKIKDILIEIANVNVRGLWLTKIDYADAKNTLDISVKGVDQIDIYKYSSQLSGVLRGKKFCLLEVDMAKRGENPANVKKSNKPVPFVVSLLARRRDAAKKKEAEQNATKNIDEEVEKNLRWIFNYEATFKYGNCF